MRHYCLLIINNLKNFSGTQTHITVKKPQAKPRVEHSNSYIST